MSLDKTVEKLKKELDYKGCRNCRNQIESLRTCKWMELGGDGCLRWICPRWEKRREDGKTD